MLTLGDRPIEQEGLLPRVELIDFIESNNLGGMQVTIHMANHMRIGARVGERQIVPIITKKPLMFAKLNGALRSA